LVAGIADRHIQWRVGRYWNGERPSYRLEASVQVWPRTPTGAVFNTLEGAPMTGATLSRTQRPFTPVEFSIPLLAALDDPDRFLVEHLLESEASTLPMAARGRLPVAQGFTPPDPDGSFDLKLYDFRIRLRPRKPFGPKPPGGDPESELCTASVAPADAAALRDGWHRRLDVPVVSVAHWQVVAITALLPLFWSFRRIRLVLTARRRRRQGRCLHCGYDVRASADRCPECGEQLAGSGARADSRLRDAPALVSPPADR
jgi:hypothetical protein